MKFVTTTLLCLITVSAFTQNQITTFKTGSTSSFFSSRIIEYRDQLVIVSSDEYHGSELWVSDGTLDGTKLVKDINLGTLSSNIDRFVKFKDHVYFTANDGIHGLQIWRTDGTGMGTRRVTSELAGIEGPIITDGNWMYFLSRVNSKLALWRSDGTTAGATLITNNIDIVNAPENFTVIGNLIYFTVGLHQNSSRVWRSDGTASGTFPISDALEGIDANSGNTLHPSHFVEFNGELYFIARNGLFSPGKSGLVKATGNLGETTAIKEFYDGSYVRYGNAFTHNNKMYFAFFQDVKNRLFIVESDGTSQNTSIIFDESFPSNFSPSQVLVDGNYFYFTVANGDGGTSLAKFDLTLRVKAVIGSILEPYNDDEFFRSETHVTTMAKMNEGIFITAKNGKTLSELWHFDIPSETIRKLGYVNSGNPTAVFREKFHYTGKSFASEAYAFWQSDGTAAGTKAWFKASPNDPGFSTFELFPFTNKAVFRNRDDDHGQELWITDGTIEGTRLLVDVQPGEESSYASPLLEIDGSLIFAARDADGKLQLFRMDEKSQGISSFTSVPYDVVSYKALKRNNSSFFFSPRNSISDGKTSLLYISDGTMDGTEVIKSLGINGYGVPATVINIVLVNDQAIFSTTLDKDVLWTTDGTEDGTIKIAEFSKINNLLTVNNTVYFTALQGNETELYRTDGTVAGTTIIKNLNGSESAVPNHLVAFNNKLIFTAVEEGAGRELWITDGTDEGTKLVKDIALGVDHGVTNPQTVVLGDNFYFTAHDLDHGSELWKSDGSQEGTILLKDIVPGSDESRPGKFTVIGDKMYFQAYTPEHGYEVWVSDGTATNTKLKFDLVSGPTYSNPESFIKVDDAILFFAFTPTDGRQLWSYREKVEEVEEDEVEIITGIEQVQNSDILIFPNPSTGSYFIFLHGKPLTNATLEVLTLSGSNAFSFDYDSGKLNLQNLSPGIYIVNIRANKRTFTKKVVKF